MTIDKVPQEEKQQLLLPYDLSASPQIKNSISYCKIAKCLFRTLYANGNMHGSRAIVVQKDSEK